MQDILIFESKKYISARRASEISDYSSDYIGQLCRAGKLDCRMVGRSWFVTEESLLKHEETVTSEESNRNRIQNLLGKNFVKKQTRAEEPKMQSAENIPSASGSPVHPSFIRASEISDYSTDYIGQLCRAGKLECQMIGRSWFVSEESLLKHKKTVLQDEVYRKRIEKQGKKIDTDFIKRITRQPVHAPLTVAEKIKQVQVPSLVEDLTPRRSPFSNELLSYLPDNRPLTPVTGTPVAKSTGFNVESNGNTAAKNVRISLDVTYPELFRSVILKRVIKTGASVAVLTFVILGSLSILNPSVDFVDAPRKTEVAGAQSSANVLTAVTHFLSNGFDSLLAVLGHEDEKLAADERQYDPYATSLPGVDQGIVVFPSTGSRTADYALKQKIQNNFSDQVEVHPDESGTAGVITPVFRQAKGNDFVYVMVPLNGSRAP